MATRTKHFTGINSSPDVAVTDANDWMQESGQAGFGLAPDRCEVEFSHGNWYVTAFLRDDRVPQRLNHTTNGALWQFQQNLFNGGFSAARVDASGIMHYFGSRK